MGKRIAARHAGCAPHAPDPQVFLATKVKLRKWWRNSTILSPIFTSKLPWFAIQRRCPLSHLARVVRLCTRRRLTPHRYGWGECFHFAAAKKGERCVRARRVTHTTGSRTRRSHSSGIRRHDERIADAIEMNGIYLFLPPPAVL